MLMSPYRRRFEVFDEPEPPRIELTAMPPAPRGPSWARTFGLAVAAVCLVKLALHLAVLAMR